jgi:hypothetical protein
MPLPVFLAYGQNGTPGTSADARGFVVPVRADVGGRSLNGKRVQQNGQHHLVSGVGS